MATSPNYDPNNMISTNRTKMYPILANNENTLFVSKLSWLAGQTGCSGSFLIANTVLEPEADAIQVKTCRYVQTVA